MIYLVDLFCGGGGTSTGASFAEGVKVIYCVNHDPIAIKSHAANHPDCIHTIEDIRKLDINPLKKIINDIRKNDPTAIIGLWASLECTNHSKAKGGLSRDADSRTLANDLLRYIEIDFDIVYIENVREFLIWGPLIIKEDKKNSTAEYSALSIDKKGNYHMIPDPEKKEIYYKEWVNNMKSFGFKYDYKLLNSADFGAFTSRLRYFAQFAKDNITISWPSQTHKKIKKKKNQQTLFEDDGLMPWKAVREVLDLDIMGESIFNRKKPITSDKTFERIYNGLIEHVAGMRQKEFIQKYYGTGKNIASLDQPSPTLTTKDRCAIISTDELTTRDRSSNISIEQFVYRDFGTATNTSINTVVGAVTNNPKLNLISPDSMILNFNSSTAPIRTVNEPAPTVTTVRTHYIINPSWFNTSTNGIDKPCPTLIARMDKAPHYLVITETGDWAIEVYENDLPHAIKIKQFMAMYGLRDVYMRMFSEIELLRIMGFPENYILCGNQTQNKKFIGNAVEVNQAKVILQASYWSNVPINQKMSA